MSQGTAISWSDATWPIVAGCDYVSPGCSNCWAVRDSYRLAHNPHAAVAAAFADTVRKTEEGKLVWSGLVRPLPERLGWPLAWAKPRRVFVCSQSDLFHERVPFHFIAAAFGVMAATPHHTYQVLTKHPRRALEFFHWLENDRGDPVGTALWQAKNIVEGHGAAMRCSRLEPYPDSRPPWPLPNVWGGVTVEDQTRANERIPYLLRWPVALRWLSVEPMITAIDLTEPLRKLINEKVSASEAWRAALPFAGTRIDWVVCGGESAQTRANTRPFELAWAYDLLAQCRAAGVAFHLKQLGTKPMPVVPAGVVATMRNPIPLPPGKSSRYKWHEPEHWPAELRVQEFPQAVAA